MHIQYVSCKSMRLQMFVIVCLKKLACNCIDTRGGVLVAYIACVHALILKIRYVVLISYMCMQLFLHAEHKHTLCNYTQPFCA